MKKSVYAIAVIGMAVMAYHSNGVAEEDEMGPRLFKERGCGACHDATSDQTTYRLGPSLKQIAEAYEGREEDLVNFLKGGCEPIVDKARFQIMHGEIVKLRDLSDEEYKALQEYICEVHSLEPDPGAPD